MSDSSNTKEIVREFYESYNAKNLDASFSRFIATNLQSHSMGQTYTAKQWRDTDKQLFPAFADFSSKVLDQVVEGNKVATRFVMGGTQTAEYMGIPPSGVAAEFRATGFDLVENGKIIEHWSDVDFTGFLEKLQKKT